MTLVVEKLALFLRTLLIGELAAAHSVPHRCLRCLVHAEGAQLNKLCPNLAHDGVKNAEVCLDLKVALWGNFREARQEVLARYSNLIEHQVAIIDAVVAKFATDVTDLDSL